MLIRAFRFNAELPLKRRNGQDRRLISETPECPLQARDMGGHDGGQDEGIVFNSEVHPLTGERLTCR